MRRNIIGIFFFFPLWLHAEYFKHIGIEEGLSQQSVIAIYQDTLGRMWFGTREGISVYDGNSVVSYKGYILNHSEGGEPFRLENSIYSIKGNKNGDIFIKAGLSLVRYDVKNESFHSVASGRIRGLNSYAGDIWCVYKNQVYVYDNDNDTLKIALPDIIDDASCLTVTEAFFYVGSKNGLFIADRKGGEMRHILKGIDIYEVFESSGGDIWIGCRMGGLYHIGKDRLLRKIPCLPNSPEGIQSMQIRNFAEDGQGNIWFGTFDGLQKYDVRAGKYSIIRADKNKGGLDHSSVFAVHKDRQGVIWVGTYYGGVNYFNPDKDFFTRYNYDHNDEKGGDFFYLGEMAEDKDKNLWICTDGGGLLRLNPETGVFANYQANGGNSIGHNKVKSVSFDEKRNVLFIGTYLGGLSRYDISRKIFRNYGLEESYSRVIGNLVYHVAFWNDRLYFSSNTGIFVLNPDTDHFTKINEEAYCENFDIDREGNAWLLAGPYLTRINLLDPNDVTIVSLVKNGYYVRPTKIKASDNGAWFGSFGDGFFFYDSSTNQMTNYSTENMSLPSNYCYNIDMSSSGTLFITTDKGIMLFSPSDGTVRSMEIGAGFPQESIISEYGIFAASDDKIYVGDTKGLTGFYEGDIHTDAGKRHLYFSMLTINNIEIHPGDGTGVIPHALPFIKKLELKYHQNNVIVGFALSNHSDIYGKPRFEYMLEGFDKRWYQSTQMILHYRNLAPGKYTLRVRSESNDPAVRSEITLPIVILSPWYASPLAWFVYAVTAFSIICVIIRSRNSKRKLAISLERELFEKEQIEKATQDKLSFFTNVSHELRTPLTLIVNHTEQLVQQESVPPAILNKIIKIRKNSKQMNNLVSELLDFRKFEQDAVVLKISYLDIVYLLKEIYLSFFDYAQQRKITYLFSSDHEKIRCRFDPAQMEKVFFNLLSNAFRHTPDNGEIHLDVSAVDDEICVKVKDNGWGIDTAEMPYIFNPYYQAPGPQNYADRKQGTGIGLALTKAIVERHHGTIGVESRKNCGSTFTVCLPVGEEAFAHDKGVQLMETPLTEAPFLLSVPNIDPKEWDEGPETELDDTSSENNLPSVLIVEDNEDILNVLRELYAPHYRVIVAHNGKEGLDSAVAEKPDLIVSDVMMPEMSGTEMCMRIKNDIRLCHIPIILLTALNTSEQNMEGLNNGADDYITKPFHSNILLAKSANLIRNRLLVRRQIKENSIAEVDLDEISPLDKEFLEKAVGAIEKHIDDPSFGIPVLCKEVGMSRTVLFAKVKTLTGMTPNNFILNHKLILAAAMLVKYPKMLIADISDRLGFGSSVYFARCFRGRYKETPQAYRRKKIH